MIREDILQQFPELFGTKKVNGRDVNVEETIATLTRELRPAIAEALSARRALLESAEPVRKKYAWPKWDETFEDPVTGRPWTFRQIVQGMIDNFLDRESAWRWRLNDEVPIPADVHPLTNPGLELTGPWHPLDMAFNALNSAAPMNMPDFEDASPAHFQPQGTRQGSAGGNVRGPAERQRDFRRPLDRQALRSGEEGQEALLQDQQAAAAVAHAPGSPAQHSRALRTRHGRWPTRSRPDRGGRPLGVQQLRRAEARRHGRVLLHPEDADAARSAHRGEAAGARGRHHRRSRRHLQDQDSLRGRQRRPLSAGDCLGLSAAPAGNQRRPLGLSRQPDRDVEGRPERRLSRSADHRHGLAQHDRLPALQRAHDAHGGHEARRTHARVRPSAGWRRS